MFDKFDFGKVLSRKRTNQMHHARIYYIARIYLCSSRNNTLTFWTLKEDFIEV